MRVPYSKRAEFEAQVGGGPRRTDLGRLVVLIRNRTDDGSFEADYPSQCHDDIATRFVMASDLLKSLLSPRSLRLRSTKTDPCR